MACLYNLPNEITLKIIQFALPDDIESFTSTCKEIYQVAAKDLQKHRALKQKHGVYHFYNSSISDARCSPLQLLDEILREPHTAYYVREISLNDWSWDRVENLAPELRQGYLCPSGDEGVISRLEKALLKLVHQHQVLLSRWLKDVGFGNKDAIISLLLLLLPNLSTFKADFLNPIQQHLPLYIKSTVHSIATMKLPGKPLSRLRHVQVADVKLLGYFAALPSMVSIHCMGIRAIDTETWSNNLVTRESKVEELVFTKCSISTKRLFGILGGFNALRSFTYCKESQGDEKIDFDPFWICSALSAYAGSTLESLTLLSHDKDRHFMGEICSFENLRHLHTESQLLLCQTGIYRRSESLARALPPSLETLELECSGIGDENEIAQIISTLAKLKTKYVPALRQVNVITRNGIQDFTTIFSQDCQDCPHSHAASPGVRLSHTNEPIFIESQMQGFKLRVQGFDPAALEYFRL